ncbi:MAG: XkdX family protein [Christensenellaceae bacterium]
MKILAESLKRLYMDGKVSKAKVNALRESKKLTEQEREYILGEEK